MKLHSFLVWPLIGLLLTGCRGERWQEVYLQEGRFSIEFPGAPRYSVSRKQGATGVLETHNYNYKDEKRDMTFGAHIVELQLPKHDPWVATTLLEQMDFKYKGRLPEENTQFTWGPYPGHELLYDLGDGRSEKAEVYVIDGYLFKLRVEAPREMIDSPEVRIYFDSFRDRTIPPAKS